MKAFQLKKLTQAQIDGLPAELKAEIEGFRRETKDFDEAFHTDEGLEVDGLMYQMATDYLAKNQPKPTAPQKPAPAPKPPTPKPAAKKPTPKPPAKPAKKPEKKSIRLIPTYTSEKPYKDLPWEKIGQNICVVEPGFPWGIETSRGVINAEKGDKLVAFGEKGELAILKPKSVGLIRRLAGADPVKPVPPAKPAPKPTSPKPTAKSKKPTSGGKPADGKKPKVQKVDAWDRPSVNLNKVQALTIAKLVDDYRAGEIGLVIDKIIVNPEGKLVIFLHDTASNFFPKWKAYLSDEGVLGRKFRSRVSTRRVVVREGFKYLYSTNYNVNECAMAARSLFKGTGNGSALGRKLQTCGNLKERKAKRSALYGLASKRYELIKAAGEAYSKKENRDGITWHEVLSHTASQFMQDHKQEKKINVNDLVKTLKARR